MTQLEIYKKEIDLACKREREAENNPNGWSYGCSCYESAFKAFESLWNDHHSGLSWSITTNILKRMCADLPLIAITEEDFKKENGGYYWQCPRMSSLFREEQSNGKIVYSDNNRYYCFEKNNPKNTFRGGGVGKVLNEIFPIVLPYYPPIEKYKVCVETSLINPKNGDFDTRAIWWVQTSNGERVEINRFFTEIDRKWIEITKDEYDKLWMK
jgi:hypothetical protein